MKVYRDKNGAVINIGEWDTMPTLDHEGSEVELNPVPEGAVVSDEEVVRGWDGGLYAHDDPRKDGH